VDDVIIDGNIQNKIELAYQYDSRDREIAIIEALGTPLEKVTIKEYNLISGELETITKPDGEKLTHEYDFLGRLSALYSSDKSIHYIYHYDRNNNTERVEDLILNFKTKRVIDQNNLMKFEDLGIGLSLCYDYDAIGRVTKVTWPDQSSVDYFYDADNLVQVQRKKGKNSFSCNYTFNKAGKIAKIDLPHNAGSIDYTYDICMRPKTIESQHYIQRIPEDGYDSCSNVIKVYQKDILGEITSVYAYDSLHHLISESGTAEHVYQYDSLHNRINKNGFANVVNDLNQLKQQKETNFEYDFNGNLELKKDTNKKWKFTYDALDRLTTATCGNKKTVYIYDAFHRRLKKIDYTLQNENWIETDEVKYLYQGDKEVAAIDKKGQILEMRTLGLGLNGEIGAAILLETNDQILSPLHDFRGNVVALVNVDTNKNIESYRYSAFGEEQIFDSLGNRCQQAISSWRFSSKRVDPETGYIFYGRRYYDPEFGKWTTPDPIGFNDGRNPYCFVRNRPMVFIDPDGRVIDLLFKTVDLAITHAPQSVKDYIGDNYEMNLNQLNKGYCAVTNQEYTPNFSCKYKVGTDRGDGRIATFNNGICNTKEQSMASATSLADMLGCEVYGVHNATFGFGCDVLECYLNIRGIKTPPVKFVAENWQEALSKTHLPILHNAHSQGGIHTTLAAELIDAEMRQRIHVVLAAPAARPKNGVFASAVSFSSKRDFVPLAGPYFNGTEDLSPIMWLSPESGTHLHDHRYESATLQERLKIRLTYLSKKYWNQHEN
jgi:RHS repeat-associated protein